MTNEAEQSMESRPLLTPRRVAIQVIGWLIGIGLLAWIIKGAVEQGDWQKIRAADPWLVAALLGCTLASAILNGSAFWITIRPIRPPHAPGAVRWRDLQLLNLVANMLNYAPVRLGAVARVLYHLRVDRLSLIQVGAWFSMIGYVLLLGVGAALLATLVRSRVDWIWLAIVVGQMAVGGALARFIAAQPLVARLARGLELMVVNRPALWGAIALRLLDLAAYAGRMAAAIAMLGLALPPSHVIILSMVALAASLMPVVKVGFREFCVAAAASRLNMQEAEVQGTWDQLALIESAGEAIVFIPLGAVLLLWFRKRMVRGGAASAGQFTIHD